MDFDGEANYNIMYQPCIIPYIPSDTVNACINTDVLTSEMLFQINEYLYNLSTCRNTFQMVFTEEGLALAERYGRYFDAVASLLADRFPEDALLSGVSAFLSEMPEAAVRNSLTSRRS